MIWRDSRSRSRRTNGARRWPALSLRNGHLHAENYVGLIETRRGTVIEILPRVDLSNDGDGTTTISGHAGEPDERPFWFHDR